MADKGIIFSAPMVRALLDGRKTQTRRHLQQPSADITSAGVYSNSSEGVTDCWTWLSGDPKDCDTWGVGDDFKTGYCPGQRLYVREACRAEEQPEDGMDGVRFLADEAFVPIANDPSAGLSWLKLFNYGQKEGQTPAGLRGKGVPSIHMPRWASRMWLAVTDVRVQRLQECSEADAIAEGIEPGLHPDTGVESGWRDYSLIEAGPHKGKKHPHAIVPWREATKSYETLWNSLHTAEGERWQDDPWVVAVTFDVHQGNINNVHRSRH